jgi:hypothetical protein
MFIITDNVHWKSNYRIHKILTTNPQSMKKKGIFWGAICLVIAINIAGFSISVGQSKVILTTVTTTEEEEGPCCWSKIDYKKGSQVLKCVVCVFEPDHTDSGTHDGHCPSPPPTE